MRAPRGGRPPRPAPAAQPRLSPDQPVWEVDDPQHYLVANVRDSRLAKVLQQYRAAAAACRRAS